MFIDCGNCAVRGVACSGCLVSALIEPPPREAGLTVAEHRAIEVFARAGFDVEVVEAPPAPAWLTPRPRPRPRPRRRRRAA